MLYLKLPKYTFSLRQGFSISRSEDVSINCLVFILLTFVFTRGALQKYLPTHVAMMLQMAGVGAVIAFLLLLSPKVWNKFEERMLLTILCFAALAVIGAFLTGIFKEFYYWGIYLTFNFILMTIFIMFSHLARFEMYKIPFHKFLLFWGWVLVVFGFLDSFNFISFPGRGYFGPLIRTGSLVGSMLHYPLLISLIAYCTFQWYLLHREKKYLLSGLVFALIPLITFSRSGVFIIGFTMIVYCFLEGKRSLKKFISYFLAGVIFLFLFVAMGLSLDEESVLGGVFHRVLTAGSADAGGNEGRLVAWARGIEYLFESNVFFGEYTGIVTRSTGTFVEGEKIRNVESGLLQVILNFGLFGALAFYTVFVLMYKRIYPGHTLIKSVFIAGLTQGIFHASIETFCYMVLMGLLPWVSQTYQRISDDSRFEKLKKMG